MGRGKEEKEGSKEKRRQKITEYAIKVNEYKIWSWVAGNLMLIQLIHHAIIAYIDKILNK